MLQKPELPPSSWTRANPGANPGANSCSLCCHFLTLLGGNIRVRVRRENIFVFSSREASLRFSAHVTSWVTWSPADRRSHGLLQTGEQSGVLSHHILLLLLRVCSLRRPNELTPPWWMCSAGEVAKRLRRKKRIKSSLWGGEQTGRHRRSHLSGSSEPPCLMKQRVGTREKVSEFSEFTGSFTEPGKAWLTD